MLNYSAEADLGGEFDAKALERARLEEVERALDEAGRFERDVEAQGGMAGSTAFAVKIVSDLPTAGQMCGWEESVARDGWLVRG